MQAVAPAPALLLALLGALQLWPAVRGGPQQQRFAAPDRKWPAGWLSKVESFTWENCGPASDPAVVKSLSIDPSPISIPGYVTASAAAATTVALESPLKADVTLERRLGELWIKIPCLDKFGSCMYEDLCTVIETMVPPGEPCPEPLLSYGIPCHCPFAAGSYNLPSSQIYVPKLDLPSFLTDGDYRLKAVLSNGDQQIGCIQVSCSLQTTKTNWQF